MSISVVCCAVLSAGCGHVKRGFFDPDAGDPADAPPPIDTPPGSVLDLAGDLTPVHDPAIIASATEYQVFSTGDGIRVQVSPDLIHWQFTGIVFATKPAWITTTDPNSPNNLWAPDVSYFGGQYHLYYAASSFGSNDSCIGHAVSSSLEPATWNDLGAVICSTSADDWNAIDPAASLDAGGQPWLALGSFWSGLKLIPLAADGSRSGTDMYSLATRNNTAVEASYVVRRDPYYYLFESVDFCCQGVNSTYKIMVGRATDITGPYIDSDGVPLLAGGGTLLVSGDARWRGPGHNAILRTPSGDYNVYHSYDASNNGVPTLRIAQLTWSTDGWPISGGP